MFAVAHRQNDNKLGNEKRTKNIQSTIRAEIQFNKSWRSYMSNTQDGLTLRSARAGLIYPAANQRQLGDAGGDDDADVSRAATAEDGDDD